MAIHLRGRGALALAEARSKKESASQQGRSFCPGGTHHPEPAQSAHCPWLFFLCGFGMGAAQSSSTGEEAAVANEPADYPGLPPLDERALPRLLSLASLHAADVHIREEAEVESPIPGFEDVRIGVVGTGVMASANARRWCTHKIPVFIG